MATEVFMFNGGAGPDLSSGEQGRNSWAKELALNSVFLVDAATNVCSSYLPKLTILLNFIVICGPLSSLESIDQLF